MNRLVVNLSIYSLSFLRALLIAHPLIPVHMGTSSNERILSAFVHHSLKNSYGLHSFFLCPSVCLSKSGSVFLSLTRQWRDYRYVVHDCRHHHHHHHYHFFFLLLLLFFFYYFSFSFPPRPPSVSPPSSFHLSPPPPLLLVLVVVVVVVVLLLLLLLLLLPIHLLLFFNLSLHFHVCVCLFVCVCQSVFSACLSDCLSLSLNPPPLSNRPSQSVCLSVSLPPPPPLSLSLSGNLSSI